MLSPERCSLAFRFELPEQQELPERFITAIRLNGWEVSLTAGDRPGLPAAITLELLNRVRSDLRTALMQVGGEDDDGTGIGRRKLRSGKLERPADAVKSLVDMIEGTLGAESAGQNRDKKKPESKRGWTNVDLAADLAEHDVEFLRPLEVQASFDRLASKSQSGSQSRGVSALAGRDPYECPSCGETFRGADACRKHLKATGHLELSEGMSWKTLVKERCHRGSEVTAVGAAIEDLLSG